VNRPRRVRAAAGAAWASFLRRRTAVFFTFLFPVLLVVIFGALVETGGGGGLFARPPGYYVPGYLAVVVLFTPLSRVGSTVARHRDGNRFEKLATTPLTRADWLLAHTLVNVVVIGAAALLILGLVVALTGAGVGPSPLLVPFVAAGVALFCGFGAILGRVASSQDGVVAAANAVALPLVFLSETFVPPEMLPAWFRPYVALSPLTYFARGVREASYAPPGTLATWGADPLPDLAVLAGLAVLFFVAGAYALPRTDCRVRVGDDPPVVESLPDRPLACAELEELDDSDRFRAVVPAALYDLGDHELAPAVVLVLDEKVVAAGYDLDAGWTRVSERAVQAGSDEETLTRHAREANDDLREWVEGTGQRWAEPGEADVLLGEL